MRKVVDIHTHLFNLKYLPVAGILVRYANPYVSPKIATAVEKLLISGTNSTFAKKEVVSELALSDSYSLSKGLNSNKSLESDFLKTDFHTIKKDLVNVVPHMQFMESEVTSGLEEFQIKALSENFISEFEAVDFQNVHDLSWNAGSFQIGKLRHLFERLIEWICTKVKQLANYFKWFRFMQKSEEEILKYLMTKDESSVSLYVHHMMDVDSYFNSNNTDHKYGSYFAFSKQVEIMAKLNQQYSDKIIGFVAFDPSKADCIEIVSDAIEKKNFKGIKFYPPMGYRANGDDLYRERIDSLFTYCITRDIPIFAHCNKKGFEANPTSHSGHNSNPMYWLEALKRYPKLRLCLAHAGGGEGWFANINSNDQNLRDEITDLPPASDEKQVDWNSSYAKIVYKLCLLYENVYCDVAYLDELSDVRKYSYLRMRLQNLFRSEPDFSKKIIYGSDWHMLFQEGINQTYMSDYISLFDEIGFTEENREDFFWNNALRYLKIQL